MDKAALEAVTSTDWASVFVAGTLDFAMGLQADGNNLPELSQYTITHNIAAFDLTYVSTSFELSEQDPDEAYVVLKVLPNETFTLDTDIKAWITIDDGANYEQVTGLTTIQEAGDYDFLRAELDPVTPRTDGTARLKVTTHNGKDIEIHAVFLGFKWDA
jgi:hypothetical protein